MKSQLWSALVNFGQLWSPQLIQTYAEAVSVQSKEMARA
jgi:hypothetical protein